MTMRSAIFENFSSFSKYARNRRVKTSFIIAKSLGDSGWYRILNLRYWSLAGSPFSQTTMEPTGAIPCVLEMS